MPDKPMTAAEVETMQRAWADVINPAEEHTSVTCEYHPSCTIARLITSHRAVVEELAAVRLDLDMRRDLYKIQTARMDGLERQLAEQNAEATRLLEIVNAAKKCLGASNGSQALWDRLCKLSNAFSNYGQLPSTPPDASKPVGHE